MSDPGDAKKSVDTEIKRAQEEKIRGLYEEIETRAVVDVKDRDITLVIADSKYTVSLRNVVNNSELIKTAYNTAENKDDFLSLELKPKLDKSSEQYIPLIIEFLNISPQEMNNVVLYGVHPFRLKLQKVTIGILYRILEVADYLGASVLIDIVAKEVARRINVYKYANLIDVLKDPNKILSKEDMDELKNNKEVGQIITAVTTLKPGFLKNILNHVGSKNYQLYPTDLNDIDDLFRVVNTANKQLYVYDASELRSYTFKGYSLNNNIIKIISLVRKNALYITDTFKLFTYRKDKLVIDDVVDAVVVDPGFRNDPTKLFTVDTEGSVHLFIFTLDNDGNKLNLEGRSELVVEKDKPKAIKLLYFPTGNGYNLVVLYDDGNVQMLVTADRIITFNTVFKPGELKFFTGSKKDKQYTFDVKISDIFIDHHSILHFVDSNGALYSSCVGGEFGVTIELSLSNLFDGRRYKVKKISGDFVLLTDGIVCHYDCFTDNASVVELSHFCTDILHLKENLNDEYSGFLIAIYNDGTITIVGAYRKLTEIWVHLKYRSSAVIDGQYAEIKNLYRGTLVFNILDFSDLADQREEEKKKSIEQFNRDEEERAGKDKKSQSGGMYNKYLKYKRKYMELKNRH